MKKIVGIIAAAALATSAFAEVNFGLSANEAFAPIAYDGDDIVTVGPTATWNGLNTTNRTGRVGLSVSAENEVAGVKTDIHMEDNTHDNYFGWVKPFSFLKISAGRMDGNWKRLGFGYGAWNTLRPNGIGHEGDDLAFWRPDSGNFAPNFALLVTPVEGLEINYDTQVTAGANNKAYNELWNHARYGVSYSIEGVGTIMAQIWGKDKGITKGDTDSKAWGVINAAFQLTGVENLDAQFGVRVPTTFKPTASEDGTADAESAIQFGAGVNYKLDALALHAFFDGRLGSDDGDYGKFGFGIGGGADFAINDVYTLVGDVRYYSTWYSGTAEGDDHVVFYGGLEHHLTNATLKLGFAGSTNSLIGNHAKDDGKAQSFTFGVPVVLDINF
ncbi:hypothetical protein MSI_01840 [Treponema sp. JC4]|uniref:hypothetical protein n=1 Tax=Treponema sp. JC4 TaxID=1124982 RepID=UPI00025B0BA6|nr:hypothetical protein [Treponema sp. JC4]EID86228.1 hypothetical protein MSI_01840 [Treponema sp. JC4]